MSTAFNPLSHLPRGMTLIEASAGTGKTYTITTLVTRLIVEERLKISQILLVTFTEAATSELRERVRKRIQSLLEPTASDPLITFWHDNGFSDATDSLKDALFEFDDARISTIHGFCRRTLQEHALETHTPFDIQFEQSTHKVEQEIAADFWSQRLHHSTLHDLKIWRNIGLPRLAKISSVVGYDTEIRIFPEYIASRNNDVYSTFIHDFIVFYRKELIKRRYQVRRISPNDLIAGLDEALSSAYSSRLVHQVREQITAALIDEFQDTDPAQYRIFRKLFGSTHKEQFAWLFLIGDPKQAIYSFRGADLYTYLRAVGDAGDRIYTLNRNYRSDRRLVKAFEKLFFKENPFGHPGIEYLPVEAENNDLFQPTHGEYAPLRIQFITNQGKPIHKLESEEKVITATVATLVELLNQKLPIDDGFVLPRHITILVKTHKQSYALQRELTKWNVPSIIRNSDSVFTTKEAQEVIDILRALSDPRNRRQIRSALTTGIFAYTANDLLTIDESSWDTWLERFEKWSDCARSSGIFSAMHQILSDMQVQKDLLKYVDGERQVTNFFHLAELLHGASRQHHLGIAGLADWLIKQQEYSRAEDDSTKIRLETDDHAVQLMTVHHSKGLQFPIVFAPFLWMETWVEDCVFQDTKSGKKTFDVRKKKKRDEAHNESALKERLQESLREIYVAITRAKHLCIIGEPCLKEGPKSSAFAYLVHSPTRESSWRDAFRYITKLDVKTMEVGFKKLAEQSEGTIEITHNFQSTSRWQNDTPKATETLTPAVMNPRPKTSWRISSFSSLTQHTNEEAPDYDGSVINPKTPSLPKTSLSWSDFPKGAEAGIFLHAILEKIDFTDPDLSSPSIKEEFLRFRIPSEPWERQLPVLLQTLLSTPLEAPSELRLNQITRQQRLDELEFLLPASKISASSLAEVFRKYGPTWGKDYADQVAMLSFLELNGYLKGFIDLIFEYENRWYVVDYKSNFLGEDASSYGEASMLSAMRAHHYPLQYHLYVVALDRMLQNRLPGYSYETHFGGVHYLFLRGMSPDHPSGTGVFSDRPSSEMIHTLSAFFFPTAQP